eukprot:scaffold33235_cov101-Isochrysis_galbana.AAC.4
MRGAGLPACAATLSRHGVAARSYTHSITVSSCAPVSGNPLALAAIIHATAARWGCGSASSTAMTGRRRSSSDSPTRRPLPSVTATSDQATRTAAAGRHSRTFFCSADLSCDTLSPGGPPQQPRVARLARLRPGVQAELGVGRCPGASQPQLQHIAGPCTAARLVPGPAQVPAGAPGCNRHRGGVAGFAAADWAVDAPQMAVKHPRGLPCAVHHRGKRACGRRAAGPASRARAVAAGRAGHRRSLRRRLDCVLFSAALGRVEVGVDELDGDLASADGARNQPSAASGALQPGIHRAAGRRAREAAAGEGWREQRTQE